MTARHWTTTSRRRASGYTFAEVMVATAVASILCLALAASIGLTTQAMPAPNGSMASSIQSGRIIDRISTELESALYVIDRGANRIAFTVPDRDGDGKPERVRYTWSGVAGDPLTRQYNDNAAVSIADGIYLFTVTPSCKTSTQSYIGTGVEDANESLLIDYTAVTNGTFNMSSTAWCGQYMSPTLGASDIGWRPTRVRINAIRNNGNGLCSVQLRPADATMTPTTTVLEQYTLDSTSLTTATYVDYPLTTTTVQAPGSGMCLVIAYTSGTGPKITLSKNTVGELTYSTNNSTWTYKTTAALLFQMYGKVTRPGGTQYVNSRYFTTVGLALQQGSPGNQKIQTSSVMLNHPEYLADLNELKFDVDPTTVDMNGDGVFDWVTGGIAGASISNGKWTTTTTSLNTAVGRDYSNLTVIDLRFRSTSALSSPGVTLNALRNGTSCGPLTASLQLQLDGTQTLTVSGKTSDLTSKVLLSKSGLTNALQDVQLIIDPATTSVGVVLNTIPIGTYILPRYVSADSSRTLSITPGTGAEYQYVRVREIDPNP